MASLTPRPPLSMELSTLLLMTPCYMHSMPQRVLCFGQRQPEEWKRIPLLLLQMALCIQDGNLSANAALHALNATTGTPLWTVSDDGRCYLSPSVVNGTVYVSEDYLNSHIGHIHALNAQTGAQRWFICLCLVER